MGSALTLQRQRSGVRYAPRPVKINIGEMSGVNYVPDVSAVRVMTRRFAGSQQMGALYAGQMGDANGRRIVLTGSALVVNEAFFNDPILGTGPLTNAQASTMISQVLAADGWRINGVSVTGGGYITNHQATIQITIDCWVYWDFTAAQAAASARQTIAGITQAAPITGGTMHPFQNVTMNVSSEEPRDAVTPAPPSALPAKTPTGTPLGTPPPAATTDIFKTLDDYAIPLGLGAGGGIILLFGALYLISKR